MENWIGKVKMWRDGARIIFKDTGLILFGLLLGLFLSPVVPFIIFFLQSTFFVDTKR